MSYATLHAPALRRYAAPLYRAGQEKQPYQPYDKSHAAKHKLTLDLIVPGQSIDTLYYHLVMGMHYTLPHLLTIICFHGFFHITGDNLDELQTLLRDHLVSEVHVFNAHYHLPLPEHTPLIKRIAFEPRRGASASTH